ncbi:MAG: hypothetical protein JSV52_10760 [Candidatus Zixiibacteriota bacterium]|nr:MAG: hypothetical protein JSV52_10760 [candidate division Zixibacteria bacterium]
MRKSLIIAICLLAVSVYTVSAQETGPKCPKAATSRALIWTLVPTAAGLGLCLTGLRSSGGGQPWENDESLIVLGVGVGAFGLLFGPGTGHAYAERSRPYKGALIRLGGGAIVFLGSIGVAMASWGGQGIGPGVGIIVAGGGLCLYSVIRDIVTTAKSVDEYNLRHGFASISISPTYFASDNAPGFTVKLSF